MRPDLESRVRRNIERFERCSMRDLEREATKARLAWYEQNRDRLEKPAKATPRDAFNLVLLDFIGINPDELEIVEESENVITWLSRNECSTLEACKRIGLDTRQLCREVFEKSTQALVSKLDPELRFLRSYEEIRPYAPHCKETIVRVSFNDMIRIAIEEARLSRQTGNKGYGAVVAMGTEIIARCHDTAATNGDPSQHAEMNAIRQATEELGDSNLCGAVLYSSCEPCPMCAAAAVWANVTTIVFGASIEETVQLGKSRINVSTREIVEKSPALIEVIGGVLREECLELYAGMRDQ